MKKGASALVGCWRNTQSQGKRLAKCGDYKMLHLFTVYKVYKLVTKHKVYRRTETARAALAREIIALRGKGLKVKRVSPRDMFPQYNCYKGGKLRGMTFLYFRSVKYGFKSDAGAFAEKYASIAILRGSDRSSNGG